MQSGDLVRFKKFDSFEKEHLWKIGLLIEYKKWQKIATVLYKGETHRIAARKVQKFGKKDYLDVENW